jgi:signal peptidase I
MSAAPSAAHRPWREGIETVLMAVLLALFLKHFVVEAYRIPTGSMQPTLIGDREAAVKDRILVDKLAYLLRAPERWEVAVFRFPLDRSRSFVKRIAGVGPEELRIWNGDVWRRDPGGEWTIARRPAGVMAEHWKRIAVPEDELTRWVPQDLAPGARWGGEGRALTARGSGRATFRGGREPLRDDYFDGYPPALLEWLPAHARESGENEVGDLRLTGTITALPGLVSFTVELREGGRRYRFVLPGPAAPGEAELAIEAGEHAVPGAAPARVAGRLPAGRALAFALENLDDVLTLELDGRRLVLPIRAAHDQFASVALELEGEGADLAELELYRDVYYLSEGADPITVPAGHYFMLGDNTQDSSDSREWRFAVHEVGGERLRGAFQAGENPRTVAGPEGPLLRLVDEWGERHWFPLDSATRRAPEAAPFVPRALLTGRALAVFWPQDPRRGIWRLKWVK